MSDQAPKPTDPTWANDLYDEIVTMFGEALASGFEEAELDSDADGDT